MSNVKNSFEKMFLNIATKLKKQVKDVQKKQTKKLKKSNGKFHKKNYYVEKNFAQQITSSTLIIQKMSTLDQQDHKQDY